MPSTEWFTVGEFGEDFRETYLPPKAKDLAGKNVKLYYDNGDVENFSFKDNDVVTWSALLKSEADGECEPFTGRYVAFGARDSIYLVDIASDAAPRRSLTLVLDRLRYLWPTRFIPITRTCPSGTPPSP